MTSPDLLSALRALILETPVILASPEDALYFRSSFKSPTKVDPLPNRDQILTTAKKDPIPVSIQPTPPPQPQAVEPPKTQPIIAEPTPKLPQLQVLPLPEPKPTNASLRSLFQKLAPNIAILQEIPNDAIAKKIATRWKTKNQITPISILSFHEPPKQKALLIEISKAIDIYFGPAKLIEAETIEKEKQWDTFLQPQNLKCIIACDYTLWQLSCLMQFYKETSATQVRTLQGIPLFLLPDLSLYLKDPQLKRSLWKALCQKLSS
jgi:hypothetical protein